VEPDRDPDVQRPMRRLNPTVIALLGVLALIGLVWLFASTRNSDQDKLKDGQLTQSTPADPEKRCAAQATYDLMKRELFRRAAQLRGSDQAEYDRLAPYAALRVENPVMESQDKDTGAINCSGSVSLDLPPGVAVVGGRRTLTSDVDYTIQAAADASGDVMLLRNADAIITPLATLSRTAEPAAAQTAPEDTNTPDTADEPQPTVQEVQPPSQPQPSAAPVARPVGARPSFDCSDARSRGEVAVCSNAGLAALDRTMAAQFRRALTAASPEEEALLRSTGERFIGYRNRCSNTACIGDAYTGRIQEIRDIMQGRWQPPR
jgi:hypothetical protein